MNSTSWRALVPTFAFLLLGACAPAAKTTQAEAAGAQESAVRDTKDRKPAPDFTLKDADGRELKLSDFKGRVVLLNFWATWCGPCKFEIPWFIEFQKKYKDKGFTVIGVSMDEEGWEVVKPYLTDKAVNYPVVIGTDPVAQTYGGIDSLPSTFMIDKEGRIASAHIGLAAKKDFEDEINELLR